MGHSSHSPNEGMWQVMPSQLSPRTCKGLEKCPRESQGKAARLPARVLCLHWLRAELTFPRRICAQQWGISSVCLTRLPELKRTRREFSKLRLSLPREHRPLFIHLWIKCCGQQSFIYNTMLIMLPKQRL